VRSTYVSPLLFLLSGGDHPWRCHGPFVDPKLRAFGNICFEVKWSVRRSGLGRRHNAFVDVFPPSFHVAVDQRAIQIHLMVEIDQRPRALRSKRLLEVVGPGRDMKRGPKDARKGFLNGLHCCPVKALPSPKSAEQLTAAMPRSTWAWCLRLLVVGRVPELLERAAKV